MITNIKNMLVGQTQRVHVKCYGQDNANSPGPSQVVDAVVPIVVQVVNATATAVVDPADNRAIVITALAAGAGSIRLTESPGLGSAGVAGDKGGMIATASLAFLAGLLSLLAPCVLPLLPVLLGGALQQHRLAPLHGAQPVGREVDEDQGRADRRQQHGPYRRGQALRLPGAEAPGRARR